MKSVNRANVWLLPVTHVNSNNTAWHLDTRWGKKEKKTGWDRGGACGSDFQRSSQLYTPHPLLKRKKDPN